MGETLSTSVLRLVLRRSEIGCTRRQRQTLRGLGLTRIGKIVLRNDSPSLQGMLRKVSHLVEVRKNGSE